MQVSMPAKSGCYFHVFQKHAANLYVWKYDNLDLFAASCEFLFHLMRRHAVSGFVIDTGVLF